MLFPLVHACYKNLQHRSKHTPIIWAWRNRAKLNFLSDIHWLNDIEPLIDNLQQWERLKTAGKGNSTYCLQTWTHMSENAQNIAFFTRFVGADRKILREQEVQLPPFKMPHTVPMQPLMSYPFMASVLSWILGWQWWMITSSSRHCHVRFWWLVTGRNPGRFGWSFLLVTPCLTSASSIIQQLFEKGGACKQHPLIVPMVFDANLEFEFLSLSSMNSDSEFSFGLFCVVLNL